MVGLISPLETSATDEANEASEEGPAPGSPSEPIPQVASDAGADDIAAIRALVLKAHPGAVQPVRACVRRLTHGNAACVATPATMEMTLNAISDEWGSVRRYLETIGVTADELRLISNSLIETTTGGDDES